MNSSTKKYIGLFNDSYPPIMDGVALTVYNYAYWLQKKGEDVLVVAPKADDNVDNDEFDVLRFNSVPIPPKKPYRLGLPYTDYRFLKQIKNYSFKIIHSHNPFVSGKLALKIARKQNIPLVATFHSKFKDDFMRVVKSQRIANMLIKDVVNYFEKADEVWIPQASVEETIREYGYKGKVEVVNNGTDLWTDVETIDNVKKEAKKELNVINKKITLLFVGQHIWEKNTAMIIEALALMKDIDLQMFFVGTGYAEEEMKRMVQKFDLEEKVIFVGNIFDRETLKRYYAAADLFIFPSKYDNAPLVVREAAALHTPSVVLAHSTTSEIIKDNINGFLIEDSAQSLAEKIKTLANQSESIKITGLNASNTIAYSWEKITNEVMDRYNYLIEKNVARKK